MTYGHISIYRLPHPSSSTVHTATAYVAEHLALSSYHGALISENQPLAIYNRCAGVIPQLLNALLGPSDYLAPVPCGHQGLPPVPGAAVVDSLGVLS